MFGDILWFIIIFSFLMPSFERRILEHNRLRLIRAIEKKRKSRMITIIHRQESINFFGLPISRYIDIEDSEQILRAIRLTPDDMPIDLVLHTPGGLVLAASQIAQALKKHPAKVTVFVPHYAMSGGTLIALSADEIVMDENAVLGPVDPQLGNYPAASLLKTLRIKGPEHVDDNTIVMADIAEKAILQIKDFVYDLLKNKMEEKKAIRIANELSTGRWTHDYPLDIERLKAIGINITVGLPDYIYDLMELYRQTEQRRPSVNYIPLPYKSRDEHNGKSQ